MPLCVNKYDMGCFNHCEGVKLPIENLATGIYYAILKCKGALKKRQYIIDVTTDCILLDDLNECCLYEVTVTNSANEIITHTIDETTYSTFVFQTIIT